MKRIFTTIGLTTVLLLGGCLPSINPEKEKVIQENEESVEETVMIPDVQLKDEFYRTLLPFKSSASRGLTAPNNNAKYDIQETEEGLLRVSNQYFNPETHYFQEGQYINTGMAKSWLSRSSMSKGGLNPPITEGMSDKDIAEKAPLYLSHIVEQNYLTMTEDKKVRLAGISIGLALNSIYFLENGDEAFISDAVIEKQGKRIADEIVKRLRKQEGLEEIPIAVGLFKQESRNSIASGTYFATAVSTNGQLALSEWEKVNEAYVILPTAKSTERTKELNATFTQFKKDIDSYFPSFVNVIGTAFYRENELQSLRIEVPIQFFGTNETAGFTQFMTSLLKKYFPDTYAEVNVTSPNGPEALIVKKANDKTPFVHIYGHLVLEEQSKTGVYKTLQPYKMSANRGLLIPNIYTKYDMKEVEDGLLRISRQNFSPKSYLFQEGQYIDSDLTKSLLARSSADKEGLNPPIEEGMSDDEILKKAPLYLAHIVEQNYMTKKDDEKAKLAGVSVGLALNSIYYTRSGGQAKLTDKVLEQKGMEMAEEVVKKMRTIEGLSEVPIVVGLFKQQSRNEIVPGNYFATAVAGKGQPLPTAWKKVNETYLTLPASSATDNYRKINTKFSNFKQEIDKYFPSYVNVVGTAYHRDGNLKSLKIELPVQFYGTSEMIGFTQFITSLTRKYFSDLAFEVNVISTNGPEALIVNEGKGEESTVHIYGY